MAHSKGYGFKTYHPRPKGAALTQLSNTLAAQSVIVEDAKSAPDTTPLAILAKRISEVGYLKNMELIASGHSIGRVTPALAEAILCESKGTHKHWHICQCDREEMQRHAARLLKAAFGIDLAVVA